MLRRNFIKQGLFITAGCAFSPETLLSAGTLPVPTSASNSINMYDLFKNPGNDHRPFVRWWWNGDKVEAKELIRELHVLKAAGIGGVEINPISFPSTGDDMGKESLYWLSDEWIDMLQVVFSEAKKIGMTCDLIVGSGWPFGSESLAKDERAEAMILYAEPLKGGTVYETSQFNIFKAVDPGVTDPNPSRTCSIVSLKLVPDPMSDLSEAID